MSDYWGESKGWTQHHAEPDLPPLMPQRSRKHGILRRPNRNKQRNPWKIAFLLLTVPLLSVCGLCTLSAAGLWALGSYVDASAPGGPLSDVQIGAEAPDFTLTTLDGETVALSDYRGTPVLISFWASWCGPCRAELPELDRAARQYAPDDIAILTVNSGDTTAQARQTLANAGADVTVLMDFESQVARQYGISSIPTAILVDSDGVIRHIKFGSLSEGGIHELLGLDHDPLPERRTAPAIGYPAGSAAVGYPSSSAAIGYPAP
ncbi:MAG: TlpA family protein disulfide reductase [Anaerolineae bacterium]